MKEEASVIVSEKGNKASPLLEEEEEEAKHFPNSILERDTRWHEDEILRLTTNPLDAVDNSDTAAPIEDASIDVKKKKKETLPVRAVVPGVVASTSIPGARVDPDARMERPGEIVESTSPISSTSTNNNNIKAMFRLRQHEGTPGVMEGEEAVIVPGAVSVLPNYATIHPDDDSGSELDAFSETIGSTDPLPLPFALPQPNADLVLTAHLADDILDANERQRVFDEAMQTISDQVVKADVLEDHSQQRRRRNRIIFLCLFLVIAAMAVTVGLRWANASNVTAAPTMAPTSYVEGDSVFQSTEELYDAVDAYRAAGTNAALSDVVLRYGPIAAWNVSLITNFSRVFDPIRSDLLTTATISSVYEVAFPPTNFDGAQFNEDLSGWDVSNAVTMMGMFSRCDYFTGAGLELWNVPKVRDFSFMFMGTSAFNGTLSNWNTSSAERMEGMFLGAYQFNGNLSSWDVARVTDMNHMFFSAASFLGHGLSQWNVSNVVTMDGMFQYAYRFNGALESWDTRSLTSVFQMFFEAEQFNRNLSTWTLTRVTSLNSMFVNAISFNGDISSWDVSRVTDFRVMASGCLTFNQNLSSWDTSQAEHMRSMFNYAQQFKGIGLENWNTSKTVDMQSMFREAVSFVTDISSWDVHNVNNMEYMFAGALSFNIDISQWNLSSLQAASSMFLRASAFNQNLCPWQSVLPPDVNLNNIFDNSGCSEPVDPVLQDPNGTFCMQCAAQ